MAVSNVQTHGWSGGCRRLWHAQHKAIHLYHLQISVHICKEATEKMETLMMWRKTLTFCLLGMTCLCTQNHRAASGAFLGPAQGLGKLSLNPKCELTSGEVKVIVCSVMATGKLSVLQWLAPYPACAAALAQSNGSQNKETGTKI